MNKRMVGTGYEKQAADYLEKQGCEILEQNFRSRFGEIDIIGNHKGVICFVEVKFRSDNRCGYPAEAVTHKKQQTITKVAQYYLLTHGYGECAECRFDVVAICGKEVIWYQNAFEPA